MTNKAWSSYWQGGELHSCAGAFGGNYEGRMLGLWLSWFGSLPANARFLDIGTGNGAILALAKQYGEEYAKPFELHGIDFADIDPARCVAGGEELFRGVQFHPNTSAADTAFEIMTPMTRGIAYRQEDRFVLRFRFGKCFVTPGIPVHWI